MTEDFSNSKRAYVLPPKKELSRESRSKLKTRRRRKQYQGVSRIVYPLKILGFILIIISLCYLSVVQLRHLFFGTSYFELKQVNVTGNTRLKKEEILKLAHVAPGLNIFKIDREAIRASISSEARIKKVTITFKGLYNLNISVVERKTLFYAKKGTTFLEVAENGMIIGSSYTCPLNFPIITGLKLQNINKGDSLAVQDSFFIAREWIKTLGNKILDNISEINLSSLQNPYVYLISGEKVYPENMHKLKKQYNYLRALLDNLKKNDVKPLYLVLRKPGVIVIKPKK